MCRYLTTNDLVYDRMKQFVQHLKQDRFTPFIRLEQGLLFLEQPPEQNPQHTAAKHPTATEKEAREVTVNRPGRRDLLTGII